MNTWQVPLRTWVGLCSNPLGINWDLYGAVLSVMFGMLNEVSQRIAASVNRNKPSLVLPIFEWQNASDASGAFARALEFLSNPIFANVGEALLLREQFADAAISTTGTRGPHPRL